MECQQAFSLDWQNISGNINTWGRLFSFFEEPLCVSGNTSVYRCVWTCRDAHKWKCECVCLCVCLSKDLLCLLSLQTHTHFISSEACDYWITAIFPTPFLHCSLPRSFHICFIFLSCLEIRDQSCLTRINLFYGDKSKNVLCTQYFSFHPFFLILQLICAANKCYLASDITGDLVNLQHLFYFLFFFRGWKEAMYKEC